MTDNEPEPEQALPPDPETPPDLNPSSDPDSGVSETILSLKKVNVNFSGKTAVKDVTLDIPRNKVTAIIGPSGCGKTTLLRTINRMNDDVEGCVNGGSIFWGDDDILGPGVDAVRLRKRIGMVFQKPNPFPISIYENITYGPKLHGLRNRSELDSLVDRCLKDSAIYDEVSDRLDDVASSLSGGQQQRLCIARTLSVEPEIILFDEPTSALDPIATAKIEDLVMELKKDYTVIIVTHNMQQAARISDYTAFMYLGELIEFAPTKKLFENPDEELTENYITGRFG